MSRIAKNSIKLPNDISCKYENSIFFAKGKLGEMSIKINSLFNMQKENIVNIFRNNSRITLNRKVIQDKIVEVDIISKKAQDLVANFHELLYKDD